MAVRGLGCPVRFTLTAGQKGDAPQADGLIEDMPADVVMADTAYDSDHLRQGTFFRRMPRSHVPRSGALGGGRLAESLRPKAAACLLFRLKIANDRNHNV
jgi:transposase